MTPLQENILKTLAYYDIFSYPLTIEEIFSRLQTNSITPTKVEDGLRELYSIGRVVEHESFYFLPHQSSRIVILRHEHKRLAGIMTRRARWMALIIKQFPFVRAIFLSGDLSKDVSSKSSDVDFFIVTAPKRLWICRSLLILFKKIFLFDSRKYFCLNHFVTETHLYIEERNLFVAVETSTVKALWNEKALREFQSENPWIYDFLPNWKHSIDDSILLPRSRSSVQVVMESLLHFLPLEKLDRGLMKFMERVWEKRYPAFTPDKRRELFRCSRDTSTAFSKDYENKVMGEYRKRVADLGIEVSS